MFLIYQFVVKVLSVIEKRKKSLTSINQTIIEVERHFQQESGSNTNKGNNNITELRTILQRESQNS